MEIDTAGCRAQNLDSIVGGENHLALSGSFYNYVTGSFGLYCEWSATQNQSGNYSNIIMDVYLSYYTISVGSRTSAKVSINGVEETYSTPSISRSTASSWTKKLLKTYEVKVPHDANGEKTNVVLSASYPFNGTYHDVSVNTITATTTVDLNPITVYSLSISAGTGSSITVNRTYSGYAGTGNISAETRLYYGDKLKITFSPSTNYRLLTTTVNGSAFTSGNTHTVAANVTVASTAQVLASAVGATNANIGSVSTITVTKYNSSYCHSLQYSFGDLSGYITSSGGVQSTEAKFSGTSVAFTVPTAFYAQIPNAKTGTCTITCRTYSSSSSATVLGDPTTCTFTATATGAPMVSGFIVDTDSATIALTGDSKKLIRYRSNPKCTITATPKNSASISTVKIRETVVTGTTGTNGVVTAEKAYANVSYTSYAFAATDSRGYSSSVTLNPIVINYVELTCSPVISRPTPSGSSIVMSVSGALYRGSFGEASNTLTLEYRYKTTDGSYGSWRAIASSNIALGTSKYALTNFSLGEDFDYKSSYVFQVRARDGATVNGTSYILSTVTKTIEVQKGIPVFDWGENDFNVNVALMLSNVNILDIMYPVGAVYMHSSSTLPAAVSGVGTWSSVTTGISGVYAWKRTA